MTTEERSQALEARVLALEEFRASSGLQQLSYPLDYGSTRVVRQALNTELTELLKPLETAATDEGTHTLLNTTPCIQFADAATKEAYFILPVPSGMIVTSLQFVWSTPATSGNLRWQIDIGAGSDSQATNARTTGGTAVSTAADGTANDLNFTEIPSSTGVNLATLLSPENSIWGFKFSRLGADAADTLSNTANLYGILVTYKLYN